MANVKKPDLIDIFKDEYHITEPSLEESTEMMRLRPSVRQKLIHREQDRKKFYDYYNKWNSETWFLSSFKDIHNNQNFKNIVNMGRRAVPFIYEIIRKDFDWIVEALEFIYGSSTSSDTDEKKIVSYERYCELWCKKIEEAGDV